MTFWELFIRLLPWRPWPALAALYWHLTRRRVRARNRLLTAIAPLPFAYRMWVSRVERLAERETQLKESMRQWLIRPHFSLVVHGKADAKFLERTKQSLERQGYPDWDVVEGENLLEAVQRATGDYVFLFRIGDLIGSTALYELGEAIQANAGAAIIYGDEDEVDATGRRHRPWFKPQWNEELFLAQDYLSRAVAIRADLARKVAMGATDIHDLLLRATWASKDATVHVPHIISHTASPIEDPAARQEALDRYLRDRGAQSRPGEFKTLRIQWPLPSELPLVSVIIPTKDKLELLRPCVDGVLNRTHYHPMEILIVNNGSVEPCTLAFLDRIKLNPRIRVLEYNAPYNFSAINNFAVREASGDYLCLLNNDTDVVGPEWLAEMMRYAIRDDVGAVGAKLLYEDGSIQHAGVAIGLGGAAGHAHRFQPNDEAGYFSRPHVAHFVTAVTAACLVVNKHKYLKVGGLDEKQLAVAFNDVDLCLKLQDAGWRNVYAPHALLIHHESKSRGNDLAREHVNRFRRELQVLQDRWGTLTAQDPLHNPNLDRYSEKFVLRL